MWNTPFRPRATTARPRLRLRCGSVFGWSALAACIPLELAVWAKVCNAVPPTDLTWRVLAFLYYFPKPFHHGLLIASGITIGSALVFALAVRPLMVLWYNPRPRDPEASLPMELILPPGESSRFEVPARRVDPGGARPAGRLVRTGRAVRFVPDAWDEEPWSLPLGNLADAGLSTPRRRVLGWVEGYPDHLVLTDDAGRRTAFIVADPPATLARVDHVDPAVCFLAD